MKLIALTIFLRLRFNSLNLAEIGSSDFHAEFPLSAYMTLP